MITTIRKGQDISNGNNSVLEMRGLSSDTKPRNISNGSMFIEINTGKQFLYDLENDQWKLIGGGGGDTPNLQDKSVTITTNTTTNVVADEEYDGLSSVSVTTNIPGPSGKITISDNGTNIDVSSYATADVNVSSGGEYAPAYISFSGYSGTDLSYETENLNTENITNMSNMFNECYGLEELDLSNFDTSDVTDMSYMFYGCSSLTSLDITGFNTSNVTDMRGLFGSCSSLSTLPLNTLNTSNVTSMDYMFTHCSPTSYDFTELNNFDTSNVTTMGGMFGWNENVETIDVSTFDTSNVTDMNNMFAGCTNLTTINFGNNFTFASLISDPEQGTNGSYGMFYETYSLDDDTLNEILHLCTTAPYTSTLEELGFYDSSVIARCHELSNYDEFIEAGWSDGGYVSL